MDIHQRCNHPWVKLSDEELLRIGGFVRKDPISSEMGYTLAAALMFGTDATIQEAAPGMVFDALLRRDNVGRYDDRVMLYTNLIETFDHLMAFVEKHLNDPFHLEGNERISLRDRIFRELVSNLIAHREYTSAAPASITIFRDKVVFCNPHVPRLQGRIDPTRFTPFPKNPTICRFMLQMGRYEQAGSGVYNVTRYLPFYSPGATPLFEEFPDVFITTIPLTNTVEASVEAQVTPQVAPQVTPQVVAVLRKADTVSTFSELQRAAGLKDRVHFLKAYLEPLLSVKWLERTIPDKPRSSRQKYRLTEKGRAILAKNKER